MLPCMLMVIQRQETFAKHLPCLSHVAGLWGKGTHARYLGLRAVTLVRGDENGDLMPSWARQEAMR